MYLNLVMYICIHMKDFEGLYVRECDFDVNVNPFIIKIKNPRNALSMN